MNEQSTFSPLIRFLHSVGHSTITQGLTVPKNAQVSWLADIKKGEKVDVEIRYGENRSVVACLRRINNAAGHLQFRYETQKQRELRDYMSEVFEGTPEQNGMILEVTEVGHRIFMFTPVSSGNSAPKFALYKPHFHNLDKNSVCITPEFEELCQCLKSLSYNPQYSQSDYNKKIAEFLSVVGWKAEVRILKEIGLRCDFEKNGVWLEVEFGNARGYYQDYIKFLLASQYQKAHFGVLLCPTNALADLLCELGQQRAILRQRNANKVPQYSGMMSYEKAIRELPYLEFMLNGRIVIAGIDIQI